MPLDTPTTRTAAQIVGNSKTHQSILASKLWVESETVFSMPQGGNKIIPLLTGEDYFKDLVACMYAASSEICILGWQVSWDAILAPGLRLYDVLLRVAKKKSVKIYVMPWDDTKPMVNYDTQTSAVLMSINDHPEVKKKIVEVILSETRVDVNEVYFSHHQKQVIIDRKIAYIGGIDLSYGRFDDAKFDLRADAARRQMLNRYNPCVEPIQRVADDLLVDPDLMTGVHDAYLRQTSLAPTNNETQLKKIAKGGWQLPYAAPHFLNIAENKFAGWRRTEYNKPNPCTLDPAAQPRMPWQDVHSRVEGPSVSDLLRNFVLRWNASGGSCLPMPAAPGAYPAAGSAYIQVLRSAPAKLRNAENAKRKPANEKFRAGTESDIHLAMLKLIEKSDRFIYLESQFFVSDFGEEADNGAVLSPAAQFISSSSGGDQDADGLKAAWFDKDAPLQLKGGRLGIDYKDVFKPPTNAVCAALVRRIEQAVLDAKKPNFHVYITLPVHPEGSVASSASIAVQVYWTMQTISFGSNSLLNGIRRAIKARQLLDKKDGAYRRVIDDRQNQEYKDVPVEDCFKYVTLLNLRNWQKLDGAKGTRYVTEQVYVHTKLMIVDDLYALLGSANVNDRSLLGERDSEIAVLVMDGDATRADVCGDGSKRPVRTYAHQLRKQIWSKLFGIAGGVRPATHLKQAIEQPGIPDSWESIQKQANKNAEAYEAVFSHIPKNWAVTGNKIRLPASIIPNWDPRVENPNPGAIEPGYPDSPLPYTKEFWHSPRHNVPSVAMLEKTRGFIVALPVYWTMGEMNRFRFPTSMVAQDLSNPHDQRSGDTLYGTELIAKTVGVPVEPAGGKA